MVESEKDIKYNLLFPMVTNNHHLIITPDLQYTDMHKENAFYFQSHDSTLKNNEYLFIKSCNLQDVQQKERTVMQPLHVYY